MQFIILTDYKGFFGSKQLSSIYRGGMDVNKIVSIFKKNGYNAKTLAFSQFSVKSIELEKTFILYTSSEDSNEKYKSFIEDIIFDVEQRGLHVIPSYAYLRAHNNKVAMELLRERSVFPEIQTIYSKVLGTFEELKQSANTFSYPVVIKTFSGAMSRGVTKADDPAELIKRVAKLSRTFQLRHDLKELLRKVKYRDKYVRESFHRSKFIVQNLIEGLKNDWKVLVYGNTCYVLRRDNRANDFRASGSGKFFFTKSLPEGMLDFALRIRRHFNVPHISLDIGFDGTRFHLIEFQFIYFGTTTIEKSTHCYELVNQEWQLSEKIADLEQVYVQSIIDFIKAK